MRKSTKWLPIVAFVLVVVVVGSLFGCAPKAEPAPAPAPTPAPQPTPTPPTPAAPAVTGNPDLEIVDVWIDQEVVYYKVKNNGTAKSIGGISLMYINGQEKADDYLQDVLPGTEEIGIFHDYEFWSGSSESSIAYPVADPMSFQVRVCIDTDNANKETNENNNCMSRVIGLPYKYDFELYATSAEWRSGNDLLKWPMAPGDPKGSAFESNYRLEDGQFYHGTLAIYPPAVANSSIQGLFGEPARPETQGKQFIVQLPLYDLEVPTQCKFTTRMAFREGAQTDGVTLSFGYIEPSLNLVWMKTANVKYDGTIKDFEVDLSPLAGQKVKFLLKVEAGPSGQDDWFTLIDPMIISKEVQYR